MSITESFIMALALSVDAFVCSVLYSKCNFAPGVKMKLACVLGCAFGLFQFLMPVIGFFAGAAVVAYISSFDHYVAFLLLAFVSVKMFKDALSKQDADEDVCARISYLTILMLAIATSIDALALGVSVGLLYDTIFGFAAIVGVTCFAISFAGSMAGQALGKIRSLDRTLNLAGAAVLMGIGIRVLYDHGVFSAWFA